MGQVYCRLESSVVGLAKAGGGAHRSLWGVGGGVGGARPLSLSPTSLPVFCRSPENTVVRPNVAEVGRPHSSFQGPTYVAFLSNSPCLQGASFSDRNTSRAELKS